MQHSLIIINQVCTSVRPPTSTRMLLVYKSSYKAHPHHSSYLDIFLLSLGGTVQGK